MGNPLKCYFCLVNNKVERDAVIMAGQHFPGRGFVNTFEFFPICDDHAATWNDSEAVPYPMFKLKYMVNESNGNYMTIDHALREQGNETVIYALNNGWEPRPVKEVVTDWVSQFHKPEDLVEINAADMCAFENRESTIELLIGFWEHDADVYLKENDTKVQLKEAE